MWTTYIKKSDENQIIINIGYFDNPIYDKVN